MKLKEIMKLRRDGWFPCFCGKAFRSQAGRTRHMHVGDAKAKAGKINRCYLKRKRLRYGYDQYRQFVKLLGITP